MLSDEDVRYVLARIVFVAKKWRKSMSLTRRSYPGNRHGLEDDVLTSETPFGSESESETEEKNSREMITIEQIHNEIENLSMRFHLSDEDLQVLKDLFTCKSLGTKFGAEPIIYNLILLSDNEERSRELSDELLTLLGKMSSRYGTSKIDAGQMISDGTVPTGTGENGYSDWLNQMRRKISF